MSALMGEFDFHGDTRAMWDELMRERGLKRLPDWKVAPTRSRVVMWIHRLGLTVPDFEEWAALSIPQFLARNPTWPLRAVVGLLLESFPPVPKKATRNAREEAHPATET